MRVSMMDLAAKVSRMSTHEHYKMGAVIARRSKVVGVGSNHYKTHPRSNHPYQAIHAELQAILNAQEDVRGCDIYIYRKLKTGALGLAKPCPWCEKLLLQSGISRVFYTSPDGVEEVKYER